MTFPADRPDFVGGNRDNRNDPAKRGNADTGSDHNNLTEAGSVTNPKRRRKYPWRESTIALPPGKWVVRRGIKVYVTHETPKPTTAPDAGVWPSIKLCGTCDTAHHADQQCPTCLEWAEGNAQKWAWQQARFANRRLIWDILEHRKQVAA